MIRMSLVDPVIPGDMGIVIFAILDMGTWPSPARRQT